MDCDDEMCRVLGHEGGGKPSDRRGNDGSSRRWSRGQGWLCRGCGAGGSAVRGWESRVVGGTELVVDDLMVVGHGVFSRGRGQGDVCRYFMWGADCWSSSAVTTREREQAERKSKVGWWLLASTQQRVKTVLQGCGWRVDAVRRVGSARKSRVQKFVSLFEMVIDGRGWGWRFF